MLCRVFVFSLVAANLIEAYIQLDYSEQGEQLHTCEIDVSIEENIDWIFYDKWFLVLNPRLIVYLFTYWTRFE